MTSPASSHSSPFHLKLDYTFGSLATTYTTCLYTRHQLIYAPALALAPLSLPSPHLLPRGRGTPACTTHLRALRCVSCGAVASRASTDLFPTLVYVPSGGAHLPLACFSIATPLFDTSFTVPALNSASPFRNSLVPRCVSSWRA